MAAHSFHVLFV